MVFNCDEIVTDGQKSYVLNEKMNLNGHGNLWL